MSQILNRAKQVLQIEADSILHLIPKLDNQFEKAVELVLKCNGKLVITGIGKSGQIARKMASTFSSTGTPALFLHPAESSHGDLGVISENDLVMALSYGGEASELNALLKFTGRRGISLIALTGKIESTLAKSATVTINVSVEKEACPLNLAPTSSSTAMLAIGDALAMCVLEVRGFKAENFAEFHPSGSLGAKLMTVREVMQIGDALPFVKPTSSMSEILTKMTNQSVRGAAGVTNDEKELVGIITDVDIRRFLEKNQNPFTATAEVVMSKSPKTIDVSELAEKALFMMEQFRIQMLIVLDKNSKMPLVPMGMLIYQDLLAKKLR